MRLSKKIESIQHSPIRKFVKYTKAAEDKGKKIYYLNIGQPDIKTPEAFMTAIRGHDNQVIEYAPSNGINDLIEAVQGYYHRYGMDYDAQDILITNGGSEALNFIMAVLCDDGDEVIVPEPYYTNYEAFIKAAGGKIVPLTTYAEEGYRYADKERIEKLITPRTKAMLLTNPGNPTGTVLTKEDMQIIGKVALDNDIFIVSDEVYREFVYDGLEMSSFGQIPEIADRTIIVDSVSKRFSACGARIGTVLSKNQDVMSNLLKLAQSRLCAPTVDQYGSAELYRLDPSYFDAIKEEYEKRRNATFEELSKIEGIVCQKPQGAFYFTVKLPIDDAEDFLIWLLTEYENEQNDAVMFTPAEGFYATPDLGKDEIRIAYVLNTDDMVRGVSIIRHALSVYQNR